MNTLQQLADQRNTLQLEAAAQRLAVARVATDIGRKTATVRRGLRWVRRVHRLLTSKGNAMSTSSANGPDMAASPSQGAVAASLKRMVDEADQLLKSAAETGDEKFSEARVRLEHQLRSLRLQLEDLEDSVSHRARQAARRADETVHTHPYGAMGAAAAVGLLIGVLLGRR